MSYQLSSNLINNRKRTPLIKNPLSVFNFIGDPLENDVVLFLRGDDFTDSSLVANTVTPLANASIDNSIFKTGTGSFLINGTSEGINIDSFTAITDFRNTTIEFWHYNLDNAASSWGFMAQNALSSSNSWNIYMLPSGSLYVFGGLLSGVTPPPLNQWRHYAFVFGTSDCKVYFDGILQGSITNAIFFPTLTKLFIGYRTGITSDIKGNLDSFRITQGARYTANFNPETETYL